MARHTKLALIVAPFLIVIGYIGSDFYLEHAAAKARIFVLEPSGNCDVFNHQCQLRSGELTLNVYDEQGISWVNSTFALDSAVLFLVDAKNEQTAYPLTMADSPFYWQSATPLHSIINQTGADHKLRVIANIKGGSYIGEFRSQTTQTTQPNDKQR